MAAKQPAATDKPKNEWSLTRQDKYPSGVTVQQITGTVAGRFYKVCRPDGSVDRLESVTSILGIIEKGYLKDWAVNLCATTVLETLAGNDAITQADLQLAVQKGKDASGAVKDAAADFGTIAHGYMERLFEDYEIPWDELKKETPSVQKVVKLFNTWWEENGLSPLQKESLVYHPEYLYAGALDALAVDARGNLCLMDWKTSNGFGEEYVLQLVAYKYAFEALTGLKIHDCYLLRVGKKKIELQVVRIPAKTHEYLFSVFLALQHAYTWRAPWKEMEFWKKSSVKEVQILTPTPVYPQLPSHFSYR